MIHHCVLLRFKTSVTEAEKQSIYDAIIALKEVVPGMLEVNCGPDVSPEGLNGGFADGIIIRFEDAQVRDYYIKHPDHVAVADRIIAAVDGGLSGILIFNLQS